VAEPLDDAELDGLLRDALGRSAEPGDPTGVADAIRARVAAGDPGAVVATTTAPGWGAGVRSWLPWVGLVVVAGLGGAALGGSGALGAAGLLPQRVEETSVVTYSGVLRGVADAAGCPGGPTVDVLAAGTRVLAVERSEDAAHVGVRDPYDPAAVLWLAAGAVIPDAGAPGLAELPVGAACPDVTVVAEEPAPLPDAEPEPQPGSNPSAPGPAQPGDTQAPGVQAWASPTTVYVFEPVTVSASASDDVGVASVTVTWSGQYSGSAPMTLVGSEWRYVFTPPTNETGTITFTVVARDAAGNPSAPAHVVVQHYYFG